MWPTLLAGGQSLRRALQVNPGVERAFDATRGEPVSIALEQLETMFESMRSKSGWDTDTPLLWGYFFTDEDAGKLEPVASFLSQGGYRVVDIYPTDDGSTTFLHVEKVEQHTPHSLFERNKVFDALAEEFGIASYDGMDVGPVPMERASDASK